MRFERGNAAAMREALNFASSVLAEWQQDAPFSAWNEYVEAIDRCRSALSEPARNCDMHDNKTAAETAFVEETGADDRSPHYWQMFANWLFWKNDRKGEN